MPWKETNVYEERMKFIVAWRQGGWSMTDLCREFGISRITGYKYLERYESEGLDGLKDKSRARKRQPKAIRPKMAEMIVRARESHPTWGARKLLALIKRRYAGVLDWPHPSTVGRILSRKGLTQKQKRQRKAVPINPLSHVVAPNDVWCADFKGHFTVGNGLRCDPLTITDAHSRFLLECRIVPKTNTESTQAIFTEVFREFGLPYAIRTDNGAPFASTSLAGLSRLSVWWLKLGIHLERIEPGKPQQNGRHERMHKTLKQSTALPPKSSLDAQQRAFDLFMEEYNYERPHEALRDKLPSELYERSPREYPERLPEIAYPTNMEICRVNDAGNIGYSGFRVFLSGALAGELVGLEEISERHARIHFASVALGIIDMFTGKVLQYRNPMPIKPL
ncbi:MAG: IS481 family transposase [Spirochaetes bacterium]|nr:IS481 family transposase [Spirochaetota bacterium]MBX3723341.1 IS481 family transposase [Turneriella sp.]